MNRTIAVLLLASTSVAGAACSKHDDAGLAPAASALAASSAAPASPTAAVWRYAVDPNSTTAVDMPGLKEDIRGGTTAAAGSLDVVPSDLTQTRGVVRVDLLTFSTHTFGNDKDATQTKHARTWLQVQVDDKVDETMRWAEFAIRGIDAASATDLAKLPAAKDGDGESRVVTLTVHGDLLVHGHKVQRDAPVEVTFHYPAGAPADSKPARVEVKSKQPLRVVLKEHDVRPRDPLGAIADWTTNLVAKVADTADVTVDVRATPEAPSASHF
jgi:hypothetical protein